MWNYEIDIAEAFNAARHDESKIPALTKIIAGKMKGLALDIDDIIRIKIEMSVKRLRKAKTFNTFNTEWNNFLTLADYIRLWINYEKKG